MWYDIYSSGSSATPRETNAPVATYCLGYSLPMGWHVAGLEQGEIDGLGLGVCSTGRGFPLCLKQPHLPTHLGEKNPLVFPSTSSELEI